MSQFTVFVKKEFLHILRDRWTTIIILVLPIIMVILFGFGISTDMKNSSFAVINPSPNNLTQKIINKLNQSEYFSYQQQYADQVALEEGFKRGEIRFALIFDQNFYQKLGSDKVPQILMVADATDPNSASTMVNYATGILGQFFQEESKGLLSMTPQISPEIKFLYNPTLQGTYNTVPGVIGMILLLIAVMMSSVSIAKEKEIGSMELLLVSPLKPITLIASKLIPYFFLSNINLITILFLGHFVLDVPINGSLFDIFVLAEIYLLLSLALGLLISSVAKTQLVALLMSAMGMILPVVMLSGLLFPTENMPLALELLSNIVPAKWFIMALKKVIIMGLDLQAVFLELSILIFMSIALIALSIKRFKIRLE